jgi:ribulose bisphosphate carboxylase small subunit
MLFFLSLQQYINNIKIYTEQGWKMAIVYTVKEIRNNIKIYTEQGWKMVIVYTVKEIRNINKGCIK